MTDREDRLPLVTEQLVQEALRLFRRDFLGDAEFQRQTLELYQRSLESSSITVLPSTLTAAIVAKHFFENITAVFPPGESPLDPIKKSFQQIKKGSSRAMSSLIWLAEFKDSEEPEKKLSDMQEKLGFGITDATQTYVWYETVRPLIESQSFSDGEIIELVEKMVQNLGGLSESSEPSDLEVIEGMRLAVELYRDVYPIAERFLSKGQ